MFAKLVNWFAVIVFSGLGIPFFLYGLIQIIRGIRLKHAGIRTEGEVVKVHSHDIIHEGIKRTYYYPTIRYTNHRGETIEFQPTAFEVPLLPGQKISVIYHPKRKGVQMDDVKRDFSLPAATLVIGLMFIAVACFMILHILSR
jgi:hypothetical protein